MKKITTTLALAASVFISGCATSPTDPGITQICKNISTLYSQAYELRSHGTNKAQALAFMASMTQGVEPQEARGFIHSHAQSAVHSVYDHPETSKKDWEEGINKQCLDKPPLAAPGA